MLATLPSAIGYEIQETLSLDHLMLRVGGFVYVGLLAQQMLADYASVDQEDEFSFRL